MSKQLKLTSALTLFLLLVVGGDNTRCISVALTDGYSKYDWCPGHAMCIVISGLFIVTAAAIHHDLIQLFWLFGRRLLRYVSAF